MMTHRFARTAAAIAVAGVVLAGCGSDDDAADAATPGAEESGEDLGESSEDASVGGDESDEEASAGDDDGGEDGSDTDSADVTAQVAIVDGAITPPPGRVSADLGDDVRIEITGDEPDEAHLHGYDQAADIIPGEVAVLEFVADQAGRFELELHDAGLQLLQLEVE